MYQDAPTQSRPFFPQFIDKAFQTTLMCNPVIHTGSKSQQIAVAVVPARYDSTRLPGKPLLVIAGKPLIVWVAERAAAASTISRTIVATDDSRIADVAGAAGFDVVMTRADHATGTDRIAEVAHNLQRDNCECSG